MTRLFVIPGHGAGDSGACGNGYAEAERVRALATCIKEHGGDSVILGDFSRNYYEDGGISYMDLPGDACIVELHMDSGGAGAHGGHVIVAPGTIDDYDRNLASLMASIFPGRSATLVERSDLANPNRAAARGFNYRLVENGFISDASDVQKFNSRIDEIAIGYLNAFGISAGGTTKKGKRMECLIRPNGENRMVYFDGTKAHPLNHPDEMKAIQWCYRLCNNGAEIPCFAFGGKSDPWATRLFEGAGR